MNASLHSTHPSASSALSSPLSWLPQWMASVPALFFSHAPAATARHQQHVLAAGNTIEVAQPLQHELVCLAGCLWITHDQTPADIVVQRGQRYQAASGSRMLVHALDDARIMVCPRGG